jgi:hypothetical protein
VLATGGDPVALGVVDSLSRPDLAKQMEDPEAHCLDARDRASICSRASLPVQSSLFTR